MPEGMFALVTLAAAAAPAAAAPPAASETAAPAAITTYGFLQSEPALGGRWRTDAETATIAFKELGGRVPAQCSGKRAHRVSDFKLPLRDPALLESRTTRVTAYWTTIKSGWASSGIKLEANAEKIVAVRLQGQPSVAGSIVSVDVPAVSVRQQNGLHIVIEVAGRCRGKESGSLVWADRLQIEVLP